MRGIFYAFCIAAIGGVLLSACTNPAEKTRAAQEQSPLIQNQESLAHIRLTYQPGDYVPTEFVCMMTDEYREMRQMMVLFEGRAYYGCCDKCQELITQNASMRTAIDPFTSKPVDKATAYIVLTGNNDKVMYFASEENHREFLKSSR